MGLYLDELWRRLLALLKFLFFLNHLFHERVCFSNGTASDAGNCYVKSLILSISFDYLVGSFTHEESICIFRMTR